MIYTPETLRTFFQRPFDEEAWKSFIIDFLHAQEVRIHPDPIEETPDEAKGYYLGQLTTADNYPIGLFRYDMPTLSVRRKRVGLRQLVKSFIHRKTGVFDAALVVFVGSDGWRLSFVCDIDENDVTAAKRFTFLFGDPANRYNTPVSRFAELQTKGITFMNLKECFSVEALSKEFYERLFGWYQWAISPQMGVTFPNRLNTTDDLRENINVKMIRLITRLLFVWFIKQKQLVPDSIFSPDYLKTILKDFDKDSLTSGNYYNAILQNLFFATLNCAIVDDDGNHRRFASALKYDTRNLYRYAEMFSISKEEVVELFSQVPFLNGGLFECLDKPKYLYPNQEHDIFYDGFSRNATKSAGGQYRYRAFVPNALFFSTDERQPGLITLLSQYNFTIEENSPNDADVSLDPELLGRAFENLLADFNPETQESARKATGSFYTPRWVVNYMVDESLRHYLDIRHGKLSSPQLDQLFCENIVPSEWNEETQSDIVELLKTAKILDPACGSGAFPMGCLLRIVELVSILNPDVDRYALKLSIIENCIYGVDIQPIAMLISKLRFFISLICDQHEIDFSRPEDNFGVNPLPNLETKFVAANTLLSPDIRKFENDLLNDDLLHELKEKLLNIRRMQFMAKSRKIKLKCQREDRELRDEIRKHLVRRTINEEYIANLQRELERRRLEVEQYKEEVWVDATQPATQLELFGSTAAEPQTLYHYDANKKKRDEALHAIRNIEADIKKEMAKTQLKGYAAAVDQITAWDPYDQNSVSPFFDLEWMFCMDDPFDIVIGNPPYIQLQNNDGGLAKLYSNAGYETFASTGDIYCLFYERGNQLLKERGILCYITSNKWMRAGYGEKLRGYLANAVDPLLLVDFAGVKIFENATVDVNILLFSKSGNNRGTICAVGSKQVEEEMKKNLSLFVQQHSSNCEFSTSDSWVVLSPIEQSIKRKIEAVGTPLKDWDIQIYRGVLTGYNDAFIISTERRNEILAACQSEEERQRTAELIRPILRGRDIKRYGYEWAELWLIYIPWHFPMQFDESITGASSKAEHAFMEQYPAVYKHMLKYKEPLSKRNKAETGIRYEWYALQRWGAKYWEDFSKPKVMWKIIGCNINFCYDENKMYCNNAVDIMIGDKERLIQFVGLMNSQLFDWYLKITTEAEVQGGGIQLYVTTLEKTLLKLDFPKSLTEIIYKRISGSCTDDEVNAAIFDAYKLTDEEQDYIRHCKKVLR